MKIDPSKELTLFSVYFDKMRHDLNTYISRMLPIMEMKDTQSGSISLKIDFAILEEKVACERSLTGERDALIPAIDYKIAMTLQSKAESKGSVVSGGHEIFQEGSAYYIVTKEEANGQLNMFDAYDEAEDESE